MIKIENCQVIGWESALRGMRNPKNSWERSDSGYCHGHSDLCDTCIYSPRENRACLMALECRGRQFVVGKNDLELALKLCKNGPVHAKFRRMIVAYMDITAPLYFWKEFDTYKVGTVANSCSTMHKLPDKKFEIDDFSHEHLVSGWEGRDKNGEKIILPGPYECLENVITMLNRARELYILACETKSETGPLAKDIWWQMIQLLPSSYNQKRTVMLSYEVLANMYMWRKKHKLDEWREFSKYIEHLPYSEIITTCGT